ncbi:MAG: DUF4159 domain-containing protein [Phycisphaerae bacterium]|nr:DUF4159 domain-containing protein [Phycisphaerae bacterium]
MIRLKWAMVIAVTLVVGGTLAQRFPGGTRVDRRGVPDWQPDPAFDQDVFTFVRIEYDSGSGYRGGGGGFDGGFGGRRGGRGRGGGGWGRGGGGGAYTDYPDSDLNFSYRLHQLTAMEVNPDGKVLRLTDPELFHYPFIYIVEPGRLRFSEAEVDALRTYLLNGGFLMVDDFWGEAEWANFYFEMKRVFPLREPVELSVDHPIFHAVFDLKEKPQIPNINTAIQGRSQGITWERPDAQVVHFKALFDDDDRMMAIICHNTDLGDGWEEEGVDEWYFHEFSETKAYPMGINIVFYAMTH